MDLARRQAADLDDDQAVPRQRAGLAALAELDRVLRFAPPTSRRTPEPSGRGEVPIRGERSAIGANDISRAVELVQSAAQTIRSAEERARESESRVQALLKRASEELTDAEARALSAEARARAAEAKAREAESRAEDAENWLRQIFSTIAQELPAQA